MQQHVTNLLTAPSVSQPLPHSPTHTPFCTEIKDSHVQHIRNNTALALNCAQRYFYAYPARFSS